MVLDKKTSKMAYASNKMMLKYLYVRNQRKDFLHKLTTAIIKNHDVVAIENLSVSGMIRNRKLARAIVDVGWYTFKLYLQYKCDWYGKHLVIIDRFEPTSKLCSTCKSRQEMPLSIRTYTCQSCGMVMDRDLNASINIRAGRLRQGFVTHARTACPP